MRGSVFIKNKQKPVLFVGFFYAISVAVYSISYAEAEVRIIKKTDTQSMVVPVLPKTRKAIEARLSELKHTHALIQFVRNPTRKELQQLKKLGLVLKKHQGKFQWLAEIRKIQILDFNNVNFVKKHPVAGLLQTVTEIKSSAKFLSAILKDGVYPKHQFSDGSVELYVGFYQAISADTIDAALAALGASRTGKIGALNNVKVKIHKSKLTALSERDEVLWLDRIGLGDSGSNTNIRNSINSVVVNGAPYNLSGVNVQVGVWDEGLIESTHPDLTGRITAGIGEPSIVSSHATHVAGTLAGDGTGDPLRQGVAPAVHQYSYSINDNDFEVAEHSSAMNTVNIDMANNSWGISPSCNQVGYYKARSAEFDTLIFGSWPGNPGRLPVTFSAGNNGASGLAANCTSAVNAGTLRQPGATAKNPIVVGAIDYLASPPVVAAFSSRGPTIYGMLKPDIVAPGCSGASCNNVSCGPSLTCTTCVGASCNTAINSTVPVNTYGFSAGTSMSTPAVTGTMALMLEQYRASFLGNVLSNATMLPSTFKVILVHSADDILPTGPDYETGYGLVNAQQAVDLISDKRLVESSLANTSDSEIYSVVVATGDTELKVTLAWDDYPSSAIFGGQAGVENQLDLLLISPTGQYYSPWQLNPTTRNLSAQPAATLVEANTNAFRDDENIVEQVVIAMPAPGLWNIKITARSINPLSAGQTFSLVAGADTHNKILGPQVSIMQVLDRSGSMTAVANGNVSPDTKLERLKTVAKDFIDLVTDEGHELGIVQFNQNVVPFSAQLVAPAYTNADMALATLDVTRANQLKHAIDDITAAGATSIGDGLNAAQQQLTSSLVASPHRMILLVTDGKENSPQFIADVEDTLVAQGVRVYPLALVYGDANIYGDRLSALADATGGHYSIANENSPFEKAYLEIMAQAVGWSVSGDPVYDLARGETVTIPVSVAYDETGVIFTAFWQQYDNAVDMSLIIPSDNKDVPLKLISSDTVSRTFRYGSDKRYAFYKFKLPWSLDGQTTVDKDWIGSWHIRLTGNNNIPIGKKVRVAATGLVKGGTKLNIQFDEAVYQTGDTVTASATLQHNFGAVTGAKLNLQCNKPSVASGTVLYNGKVNQKLLQRRIMIRGERLTPVDIKLRLLEKAAGKPLLTRDDFTLALYDDGSHGDAHANDGIYQNSFSNTKIPGDYSCRFIATNIATGNNKQTQREWTTAFNNQVAVDPDYSDINITLVKQVSNSRNDIKAGYYYKAVITPKDKFGNYLGPGHNIKIAVNNSSKQAILLRDPTVSGVYQAELFITAAQANKATRFILTVKDKPFTSILPPGLNPWSYSIHLGVPSAQGKLSHSYKSGQSITLDLEYHFDQKQSLVFLLGHNTFASKSESIQDEDIWHISANYQYKYKFSLVTGYARIGSGYYTSKNNNNSNFGSNIGLGIEYLINPSLNVQLGVDHHRVYDLVDSEYINTHIGLIKSF